MKTTFIILILSIIIAICNPSITLQGARNGLNIWFFQLLPTLLPFVILADFFLSEEVFEQIYQLIQQKPKDRFKKLCIILNITAGFTFGLPIGAKIVAKLRSNQLISKKEAQILLNNCNTLSPAFVGGYFLTQSLHRSHWIAITFATLYIPQLVTCIFQLNTVPPEKHFQNNKKIKISRLRNYFQILDISILNGFEILTILGGYLVFFGILCAFIHQIPGIPYACKAMIIGIMEVTSGIKELSFLMVNTQIKYLIMMPLISFGGLCTLLQTKAVVKDIDVSMKTYFLHKCIFACVTTFIIAIRYLILY